LGQAILAQDLSGGLDRNTRILPQLSQSQQPCTRA